MLISAYEAMFDATANTYRGRLPKGLLMNFLNACDLFPSQTVLDAAFSSVFNGEYNRFQFKFLEGW